MFSPGSRAVEPRLMPSVRAPAIHGPMEPLVLLSSASRLTRSEHPVLTVGNFDGVHRGHRVLLERLVARAREIGRPSMVYTFEPSPRMVLGRGPHYRILQVEDKVSLLGQLGVDQVCLERFSPALAARPSEWFVQEVLSHRLRPSAMVVGHDFRFGRGRSGTAELVQESLPDLPFTQVEGELEGQEIISSSSIREAVAKGRVALAAKMMGCCHRLRGRVVPGAGRGRTLGGPTANIAPETELLPARGVYAVRLFDSEGRTLPGVANLGLRPTFGGRTYTVEVHLLDFVGDLYGDEVCVDFVERIRDEQRFSGVEELVARIQQDIQATREIFDQ